MLHLATKCNKLNDHIQYCLREIVINFSAYVHSLFNSTSCSADNNCKDKISKCDFLLIDQS